MSKFNQAKFESDAKKLVAKYLNYEVNGKDVSIVGFSKVGADAKAMLSSDLDYHYFEITYFGEEGKYKVDVYDITDVVWGLEKGITVKPKDYQYCYSEVSKDGSTSHLQIGADKVTVSVTTKCPVCQEHHDILGLTNAFDLHLQEDILVLMDKSSHNDMQFPKDAFKIKYCPFCGRPLNEEENNGKSGDKKSTSDD